MFVVGLSFRVYVIFEGRVEVFSIYSKNKELEWRIRVYIRIYVYIFVLKKGSKIRNIFFKEKLGLIV